jgi:glutaredoxin
MLLKFIRWFLGLIILTLDSLFSPTALVRAPEKQSEVDVATKSLALYQFEGCPFCVKVRRQIKRLGVNIELRDAQNDPKWRQELIAGGGELQVPCLRIEEAGNVRWMYESDAINAWLAEKFGTTS